MRLAQLSRKFSVRPAEIVELLARHNITIEQSANAKVEGEALTIVIAHFAPQNLESGSLEEEVSATALPENEPAAVEQPVTVAIEETQPAEKEQSLSPVDEQLTALNEVEGVIKAPKVELKGLKVLGKIELPAPRKKENAEPPAEDVPQEQQRPVARPESRDRKERQPRKNPKRDSRNPVAQERERLAREAAERRKNELEREKERRKHHYNKKVNPKGPTKAVRRYEEHETMTAEPEEKPKSFWARIIKWLTSY